MIATLLAAAHLLGLTLGATTYVGRENQLHVRIPRIAADVTVDGVLDEPVWQQADVLTGFSEFSPRDGIPAADSTQVLVWYSSTAVYFGIRAFEVHGAVHATLADRDKIAADDNVQILLGTFHDHRQAYVFGVNPLGVQMDGTIVEQGQVLTGGWTPTLSGRVAPDLSQDFVFTSKGRLTDYGYEIEIRIPLKSIKFQAGDEQSWDLNIVREVQHSGSEDSWVPAKRANASFLSQSGTLDGLTGLTRGLVLDVNPSVTEKVSGAPSASGWGYDRAAPQVGGRVQWGITNTLTLNAAVNPDFAEVESDAGQFVIDPRQALYFPEKRPFFLEGLDAFNTPHDLIYTRRIVKPDAALKLTGKVTGTSIGLLSAADDRSLSPSGRDRAIYNVIRAQRDVGGQSRLGMAYTDRVLGGNYNRVADVDGRLVFGEVYSASFQGAGSVDNTNGVTRNAPLWEGVFSRNGKRFGLRYVLTGISEDFRAGSGFIGRPGIVHAGVDHHASWFGERGAKVETLTGDILLDDQWQYSHFTRRGDAQDKKFHLSGSAGLRGGWNVGVGFYLETFGFDQGLYSAYRILAPTGDTLPFTGRPRITNHDYVFSLVTPQWSRFSANLLYVGGQDENFFEWAQANIDLVQLGISVRPSDRARVYGTLDYQDYWRRSDHSLAGRNMIPRVKLEYQITRAIFMRLVGEYDLSEHADLRDETRTNYPLIIGGRLATALRSRSLHGDYLFSYQPTPGTVLFVGYGSQADGVPDPTQRFNWQPLKRTSDYFFVKYSYLLRV
ncbi:MAG: carbohydrate binding family 9 domain-containing protein [Gemmatimonadota bacterium]|nr:carbohydrate binding family 9 domain-containing protein [Gemmatimonadota bacterium]